MAALAQCGGDCGGDGEVTVDELITIVNIALEVTAITVCPPGDLDGDGTVTINEIVSAVNNALNGCVAGATPTATATRGATSYPGDYHGTSTDNSIGLRFRVAENGTVSGFLDFLSGGYAVYGDGGGGAIVYSSPATGQANLGTGELQLSGNADPAFSVSGQLPDASGAGGTFSVAVLGTTYSGSLRNGPAPTPGPTATPTPRPVCGSASLQLAFSNVSGNFNGDSTAGLIGIMQGASEAPAPDYIPGFRETYNSTFNGTTCDQSRNLLIGIYGVIGGLAGGQSFSMVQTAEGVQAVVYYGQRAAGNDAVWSSSAGTLYIDSVQGSVLSLRIVGASMTVTAGTATGSFTLDVSGQVNNFVHTSY
jgi:hypothetical protein